MYRTSDIPYFSALLLIGMGLGTLTGLGFDWRRLAVAGGALFIAVLIVWWQREGQHR